MVAMKKMLHVLGADKEKQYRERITQLEKTVKSYQQSIKREESISNSYIEKLHAAEARIREVERGLSLAERHVREKEDLLFDFMKKQTEMKKQQERLERLQQVLNPCGHTGAESFVCEKCGYPDPVKWIAALRAERGKK
jgi:septal ring factor EnvC (AmiA/AmiB activator)